MNSNLKDLSEYFQVETSLQQFQTTTIVATTNKETSDTTSIRTTISELIDL
jgi:hypothetical protein